MYLPEFLTDQQFGFVSTFHYSNGILLALTTEYMVDSLGPAGTFLLFTFITGFGFVFILFNVKETQNLTDRQKKQLYRPKGPQLSIGGGKITDEQSVEIELDESAPSQKYDTVDQNSTIVTEE